MDFFLFWYFRYQKEKKAVFGVLHAWHKMLRIRPSELYTWKANFSQLRDLKVKPNMAEIEAIPGRHSQSPRTRGLVQTWLRSEGNLDSKLDFFTQTTNPFVILCIIHYKKISERNLHIQASI